MDTDLGISPVSRLSSSAGGGDQVNEAEEAWVGLGETGLGNGVGVGVGVDGGVGVENLGKADTKDEVIGGGMCRWRIRSKLENAM